MEKKEFVRILNRQIKEDIVFLEKLEKKKNGGKSEGK